MAVTASMRLLGVALVAAWSGFVCAESLTLWPVSLRLEPGRTVSTLHLENRDDKVHAFQARAFIWTQSGGTDQLIPTDELQLSPPLGQLDAGGKQLLRLMLRQPATDREKAFRVLIDELPQASSQGVVSLALRMSIPVFAEPAAPVDADLRWTVSRDAGGLRLSATNPGGAHVKLWGLALSSEDGATLDLAQHGLVYLLPGASRSWALSEPGDGSLFPLRLTVETARGPQQQRLPLTATP